MRVAIQGIAGSFHDIAARRYFGGQFPGTHLDLVPCESFESVFESVLAGEAETGMIAIENTIAGSILGNYGLLEKYDLSIIGEIYVRIRHHLVALPGQTLAEIHTIIGQPVALQQCTKFLREHPHIKVQEGQDTAGAAKEIHDRNLVGVAAIAGYAAADLYGMDILFECVEDQAHNTTRFLALSKTPNAPNAQVNKASLSLRVSHRAGALAAALNILKQHHINLTKIQSTVVVDVPFEYAIHLDVTWEAMVDFEDALAILQSRALEVRIHGVYVRGVSDLGSMAKPTYATAIEGDQDEPAAISKIEPHAIGGPWTNWGLPVSSVRPDYLLIAGPCSAESEEQVMEIAEKLAATGVPCALRAGVWKPRTRAGGFEGHGVQALKWLAEAKRRFGLPIAVEVAGAAHIEACLHHGVDIVWVGARTTGNPFSVQEIADALRGTDIPVLVKNPISPDLELWIGAVERIALAGIKKIGAIHRGFATGQKSVYRNPPEWSLPLQFRDRLPNVPLICDPSHICGKRDTLAEITQKSIDRGFDGFMLEVHPNPTVAMTDASQQLTPDAYVALVNDIVWRPTDPSEEKLSAENWTKLETMRTAIDRLDQDVVESLSSRYDVVKQIAEYKRVHGLDVLQPARWEALMNHRVSLGERLGLDREFIEHVFNLVHDESIRVQAELQK